MFLKRQEKEAYVNLKEGPLADCKIQNEFLRKKLAEKEKFSEKNSCPPPIGLKPRFIVTEERLEEVKEAIERYIENGFKVPAEWIEEYNDLLEWRDKK